jgi:hypothetical protein
MAIFTSKLHKASPDEITQRSRAGSVSSDDDDPLDEKAGADDDKISLQFEDYKRQNRFQLAPEGVNRLLAEAGASTSRRRTGLLSGDQTPRSMEKGARFGMMREYVSEKEEILGGYEGVGRSLRGDIGYTMRCRAEEGYGLSDVSDCQGICT